MKTLKSMLAITILIVVSVIAGCDDNLSSPREFIYTENQITEQGANQPQDKHSSTTKWQTKSISTIITLGPDESVYLNSEVTLLSNITAYTILNCNLVRQELHITSSSIDGPYSLPCSWKTTSNFMIDDLSIQNVSKSNKTIKIFLKGIPVH